MADPEGLFAGNHTHLFRYFCRAVGRADEARDLTQEVVLRVSRTLIPAAADGDLRAWLFRIARNLVLDHPSGEKTVAFGNRVFSIRIRTKQIR